MRNVSEKRGIENQNTYFVFINVLSGNGAINEIEWKNMVQPERLQMTI
jgi:hypothetical protein